MPRAFPICATIPPPNIRPTTRTSTSLPPTTAHSMLPISKDCSTTTMPTGASSIRQALAVSPPYFRIPKVFFGQVATTISVTSRSTIAATSICTHARPPSLSTARCSGFSRSQTPSISLPATRKSMPSITTATPGRKAKPVPIPSVRLTPSMPTLPRWKTSKMVCKHCPPTATV